MADAPGHAPRAGAARSNSCASEDDWDMASLRSDTPPADPIAPTAGATGRIEGAPSPAHPRVDAARPPSDCQSPGSATPSERQANSILVGQAVLAPAAAAAMDRRPMPLAPMPEEDARAAFGLEPSVGWEPETLHLQLMVAGDSGLGKTSFIHNVFKAAVDPQQLQQHDGSSSSLADFIADSTRLECKLEPILLSKVFKQLRITVQDTPGHGDLLDHSDYLDAILHHITSRKEADYKEQGTSKAVLERVGQLSHTLSMCLYLLPPHRLRPIDALLMASISKEVPLLPLIAKADCMTPQELRAYRQHVYGTITSPERMLALTGSSQTVKLVKFDPSDLAAIGINTDPESTIPFAVVATSGPELRREYPWGSCEIMHRQHCDTILVKRLLLGDGSKSLFRILTATGGVYKDFCDNYEAFTASSKAAEERRQLQLDALMRQLAQQAGRMDIDRLRQLKQDLQALMDMVDRQERLENQQAHHVPGQAGANAVAEQLPEQEACSWEEDDWEEEQLLLPSLPSMLQPATFQNEEQEHTETQTTASKQQQHRYLHHQRQQLVQPVVPQGEEPEERKETSVLEQQQHHHHHHHRQVQQQESSQAARSEKKPPLLGRLPRKQDLFLFVEDKEEEEDAVRQARLAVTRLMRREERKQGEHARRWVQGPDAQERRRGAPRNQSCRT